MKTYINATKAKQTLKAMPDKESINQMADIFKTLSELSRLKIVLSLLAQEHCVSDIANICNQTESSVSHQLRILRTSKIVKNRRQGKTIYYSLDDDHIVGLINYSLSHVQH